MIFLYYWRVVGGLLVEMRQLWGKLPSTTLYSDISEPIAEGLEQRPVSEGLMLLVDVTCGSTLHEIFPCV